MIRYVVLGLLRSGGAQHGYALMKLYRERSGARIGTGNFYRELQRLVAEGLVQTATNPPGADTRRAPYEITEDGIGAFDAWLAQENGPGIGQHDDDMSARALFLIDADPALARRLLAQWREELWLRSKLLEREREAALALSRAGDPQSFEALAFLLGRRLKHIAADIEFLEEFQTAYEKWSVAPVTTSVPLADRPVARSSPRPTRRQAAAGGNPDRSED